VNKNMFKTDAYVLVQQTVSVMYSYWGGGGGGECTRSNGRASRIIASVDGCERSSWSSSRFTPRERPRFPLDRRLDEPQPLSNL